MVKSEIRSHIKSLLPKQDKVAKFHPAIIDSAISRVLSDFYAKTFIDDPLNLQRYCKGYGYSTPLTVNLEASTGLYYVNHPAQIVAINDSASGVRRISTPIQGGITFFPIDQREMDLLLNGSYANTVTTKIGYCVTQTRTEFYKMNANVFASGVRMDLLVPFTQYADTDDVLIPEIVKTDVRTGQVTTFSDRVLAILGVIGKVDQLDNNSNPQGKQQQSNNG